MAHLRWMLNIYIVVALGIAAPAHPAPAAYIPIRGNKKKGSLFYGDPYSTELTDVS